MNALDAAHLGIQCDLTDDAQVQTLLEMVPAVDGVACCAGVAEMKPFAFVTEEDVERVFKVNCFAPVMLVNKLLKAKKAEQRWFGGVRQFGRWTESSACWELGI